jgi:peptide/nickel transport system ATP-binding protein
MMAMLELRDIQVEYRRDRGERVIAVAGVSLDVDRGEIVGLVGETGCGKSSLAKAAVGLMPLKAGSVWFDGQPVSELRRRRRSRDAARLQLVFQNPFGSLNPRRKVGSQVADALGMLNIVAHNQRRRRVLELLDEVGLPAGSADRYPHQFSGGQRQRIAIARVLAAEPRAIVLDEPLSALDGSAQAQIADLLVKLSHDRQVGLLIVSHDLAIVRKIADSVAVMYLGLLVEAAPTADLWTRPNHPYTQALIRSIPRMDGSRILPEALSGEVGDPANPPAGCRFHPRCPYAFDRCRLESPKLLPVGGQRRAACWLVNGAAEPAVLVVRSPASES